MPPCASSRPAREKKTGPVDAPVLTKLGEVLKGLFTDFAIVSREPIIREYDHEVQGNTVLKPLAGAPGDAPQDASVLRISGSKRLMSMSVAILPEWGKTDPYAMGAACVDECVRQLVASGADPDRLAILDNFCMGNPDAEEELGALVETVKGIAAAAEAYGAPFVSGKDSFYNYFETEDGPVSIPVTILISGMGIIEDAKHVTGASLRRSDTSSRRSLATPSPLSADRSSPAVTISPMPKSLRPRLTRLQVLSPVLRGGQRGAHPLRARCQ